MLDMNIQEQGNNLGFNESCEVCNCVVLLWGKTIEIIDTTIPAHYNQCNHEKNGYCGKLRAQATLDKIEFNMHDRKRIEK